MTDDEPVGARMAAVSRSVAEVLDGPERCCRVIAALPGVAHLDLDPGLTGPAGVTGRGRVLALLGDGAVRLPLGVLLAPGERRVLGAIRVGDRGTVGAGRVELGGTTLRATRWWDPSLPRVGAGAAWPDGVPLPALPDEVAAPAALLGAALADGEGAAVRDAVERLVGLGPGLTPAGDDVLVGALAVRPGAGCSTADDGGPRDALVEAVDAVLARDPDRTTTLSAALLDQALRGFGLPQLAALLRALTGPPDEVSARWPGALAALVAVGGSSGASIGHGVRLGLDAAARACGRAA